MSGGFDQLTPDLILEAVEERAGIPLTGLTAPLPSYINRVYELQGVDGERLIAKFYRPGRWSREALQDEHNFVCDCAEDEIPVVAPLPFPDGSTVAEYRNMLFSLFPKKSGREMGLHTEESWRRLGSLIGRIHLAGSRRSAPNRLVMHPESTTAPEVRLLLDSGRMSPHQAGRFRELSDRVIDHAMTAFEDIELQRIHGDCHRANILERPESGLMIIDFDDMVTGPPVQDIWLLLPDHASRCRHEIALLLEGYEQFMEFDDRSLRLIEILRAMRMIYFLAWCSTQVDDYRFRAEYPDWGSEAFWARENADLEHQCLAIEKDDLGQVFL